MALSIKDLIHKNKTAHKQHYYIESIFLSYNLLSKALRRFVQEEKLVHSAARLKLSDYIKVIKPKYNSPAFNKKLKKSSFKDICEFNKEFKAISKELKYQYPELKLKHASQKGINALVLLNTSLVKLQSNKNNQNL